MQGAQQIVEGGGNADLIVGSHGDRSREVLFPRSAHDQRFHFAKWSGDRADRPQANDQTDYQRSAQGQPGDDFQPLVTLMRALEAGLDGILLGLGHFLEQRIHLGFEFPVGLDELGDGGRRKIAALYRSDDRTDDFSVVFDVKRFECLKDPEFVRAREQVAAQ